MPPVGSRPLPPPADRGRCCTTCHPVGGIPVGELRQRVVLLAPAGLSSACGGGSDDVVLTQSSGTDRKSALAVTLDTTSRVLRFSFGPQDNDAKIIVGPAFGQVTVFGVAGVRDGTAHNNIASIDWRSGAGRARLRPSSRAR